jgi:hypothetical protein
LKCPFLHILSLMHPTYVGLVEAQQIKVAWKHNNSSAHPIQQEAQSTQKTSLMGEGWLSLLKWHIPLNLSKVKLFKGSDVVLSDYNMSWQHLHQGVSPGLLLCNSYTRGCPHHSHPLKLSPSSDIKWCIWPRWGWTRLSKLRSPVSATIPQYIQLKKRLNPAKRLVRWGKGGSPF